jgi:hypothetical protein
MSIFEKIFGKKETDTKNGSKKVSDDANREKLRTALPEKTSILDKVRSENEQSAKKASKVKAERVSQEAAQKSAQRAAQNIAKLKRK